MMVKQACGWIFAGAAIALSMIGCDKRHAHTQPATPTTTTSAPATSAPAKRPPLTSARVENPLAPPLPDDRPRPKSPLHPSGPPWANVADVTDPDLDADIKASVTNGNRLRIKSDNIRVLRLDLGQLPPGSSKVGPWNLMLDDQAIELTGKRGKRITFVRSPGGRWEVSDKP